MRYVFLLLFLVACDSRSQNLPIEPEGIMIRDVTSPSTPKTLVLPEAWANSWKVTTFGVCGIGKGVISLSPWYKKITLSNNMDAEFSPDYLSVTVPGKTFDKFCNGDV